MKRVQLAIWMLLFLILSFVWGCTKTTGTDKDIKTNITINVSDNFGPVTINPGTDLQADIGDTDQEPIVTNEPKIPISAPFLGGNSQTAVEGTGKQEDIKTEYKKDERQENVGNPTDNSVTGVPQPVTPEESVQVEGEAVDGWWRVNLRDEREAGKWFSWLDRNGSKFTSPLVVKFPECGAEMTINDPTSAWGADGNADNHNQMFYFSGSPDKQEDTHMGCSGGCASIFSPPDCERATYALINQEAAEI